MELNQCANTVLSTLTCHLTGSCQGVGNEIIAGNEKDCLNSCKDNLEQCQWYSFNTKTSQCLNFLTCPVIDEQDADWVTGQVQCQIHTKLLVATGDPTWLATKSEVIDLEDFDNDCDNVADYPIEMASGFAGLLDNSMPLICSGFNPDAGGYALDECYVLGQEGVFANVATARWYGGSLVLNNSILWITGGTNLKGVLKSTEYIDSSGQVWPGPDLPERMDEHCSVSLNSTHSMLISGEAYDSGKVTYVFDHTSDSWSKGPALKQGRFRFGCAKFKSEAHDNREVIVAAGGYAESNGYPFDSVEILDFTITDEWQAGPKLPENMVEITLITKPAGNGVLVIYKENMYEFICSRDKCAWNMLEHKLQVGRDDYVAMLIPDDLVSCHKK